MAGFAEFLGVEGAADAEGEAAVDLGVIGKAGNAAVVDLGLSILSVIHPFKSYKNSQGGPYLSERKRIDLVLAGKLNTNSRSSLGIPSSLSPSFNSRVNLLVIRSSEDIQAVGSSDGSSVVESLVSKSSRVLGDSSLLDIITNLTTNHETLMAQNGITARNDLARRLEVEESAAMEVSLLEVEIQLLALVSDGRVEVSQKLALQSGSESVVEFDLRVEKVGGIPRLSYADAYRWFCQPSILLRFRRPLMRTAT